jgi:hypothetical protein
MACVHKLALSYGRKNVLCEVWKWSQFHILYQYICFNPNCLDVPSV